MKDIGHSSEEVQSLLAAHQRDRESWIQALHDEQARVHSEHTRADEAEQQCKDLRQREEENEARVAAAYSDMRCAQQSEKETIEKVHIMEKSTKRLASHSIGEEEHIQHLEQLVATLEVSLTKAEDTARTAKYETDIQRQRADKCEASLQYVGNQAQQNEMVILNLERNIKATRESHAKEQRRAELAENEHSQISTLLAARTSDKYSKVDSSQVSSTSAGDTDRIMQALLTLHGETREIRKIVDERTLKLSQLPETGDLVAELKYIRKCTERQNTKLHSAYAWLSEAIINIQNPARGIDTSLRTQTEKRKLAKQNLDRQVCSFQHPSDIDIP